MPKIRDHKRPPQVAFLVSPWQTKAPPPAAAAATPPAAEKDDDAPPCMYSVMTSDALLASSTSAPLSPPQRATDHAATTKPACLSSSGWHTRQQPPNTRPHAPAAPAAALQQQQQHHSPHAPAVLLPASPAPQRPADGSSDMSADETEADAVSSQPASASSEDEDNWLAAEAAAADTTQAGHSTPLPTTTTLQGVAQLVLHPSGAILGHFVALNTHSTSQPNSSTKTASTHGRKPDSSPTTNNNNSSSSSTALCLGLQGRQVLGIHSCYRDPEWALLQLSVMRYSRRADTGDTAAAAAVTAGLMLASSPARAAAAAAPDTAAAGTVTVADTAAAAAAADTKAAAAAEAAAAGQEADALSGGAGGGSVQAEAVAWVQRKGGDLVTLEPADFDDEDTEAAVMADNLGELPDNPIVNFTAHTLLCGAATAQVLQKTWPELLDQADAVVVNLGEMSIAGLPVGFLGGS